MAQMYKVYVGEAGNNQGHLVGSSKSLRGAKAIATSARKAYGGDGWSMIVSVDNGERYIAGRDIAGRVSL